MLASQAFIHGLHRLSRRLDDIAEQEADLALTLDEERLMTAIPEKLRLVDRMDKTLDELDQINAHHKIPMPKRIAM